MSRYYKSKEIINMRFVKIPKTILYNPRYDGLGASEILAYGILQDRFELSIQNGWVDENDNIYMVFDREKLGELLRVDRRTAGKYIKSLEKYGLLFDKRMGQGRANRIYMLKPIADNNYIYETIEKDTVDIENTVRAQNVTSRSNEISHQEVSLSDTNDTELNDTDFSDTLNHSLKESERMSEDIKTDDFKEILKNSNYTAVENQYIDAIEQAIRILYYTDKPININQMRIPQHQIREDLKRLRWKHIDIAVRSFKTQSEQQEIRNVTSYLSRLIYNAIFDSDTKIDAELRYNNLI